MKKKNLFLTVMGVLLLGVVVLLGGCGSDPVQEITDVIDTDLGSLESCSGDAYEAMVDIAIDDLGVPTESVEAYMAAQTEGMTHSVDDVVVYDDGTAVATVTLTCKNLDEAFVVWFEMLDNIDDEDIAYMDDDDLNIFLIDLLIDAFDEVEPTTNVFDLAFEEFDDGWYYADSENLDSIITSLFGEMQQ